MPRSIRTNAPHGLHRSSDNPHSRTGHRHQDFCGPHCARHGHHFPKAASEPDPSFSIHRSSSRVSSQASTSSVTSSRSRSSSAASHSRSTSSRSSSSNRRRNIFNINISGVTDEQLASLVRRGSSSSSSRISINTSPAARLGPISEEPGDLGIQVRRQRPLSDSTASHPNSEEIPVGDHIRFSKNIWPIDAGVARSAHTQPARLTYTSPSPCSTSEFTSR